MDEEMLWLKCELIRKSMKPKERQKDEKRQKDKNRKKIWKKKDEKKMKADEKRCEKNEMVKNKYLKLPTWCISILQEKQHLKVGTAKQQKLGTAF